MKFTPTSNTPALFGLNRSNTNKDFSQVKAWGKNSFNNCFPIALLCYMKSQSVAPVYLTVDENWDIVPEKIDVNSVFGHVYDSEDIYFAFEYTYGQNQQFVKGTLPRIDLVVMDNSDSENPWVRALEIKLTTLPDNSTCDLSEEEYGCELVVRPNTIIHLTLAIVSGYVEHKEELLEVLRPIFQNNFNSEAEERILEKIPNIIQTIESLLLARMDTQIPLIIQPIWKTVGKSTRLHENCLDVFVWSTFAFTKLLMDAAKRGKKFSGVKRTVFWMIKMLSDFATNGKIDPQTVTVGSSKQTDKAFALSGKRTHPYMSCAELSRPRIKKTEIKNIILGQGEKLLSPERRFDAILANSPELFT